MKKYILIILALFSCSALAKTQSLDAYFTIAAENNPGLQAKFKKFEAAMQKVTQVSSLTDPSISIGYFISPVETRVGPQIAKFSLTQVFPWFGTLKAQANAATLLAESNYQEFLDARNRLFYQVSAAYYPIVELQRFIAIEEENVRIVSSYKEITTVQFQNGKGALVDVLRVDIMLKDATTNLSILQKKRKPLETRFNKLLNQSADEQIIIQDSLFSIDLPKDYRRDSLLTSNPILEELELKIEASKANEILALKQGLPKIGVGLDYILVGKRTDISLPENGKDVFMPMVTVILPIFRGKYKAAQKEAELMQESYSLQKEEASNRLSSSYDMIWFEMEKQKDLIQLFDNQIVQTEQSLSLLFTSFSNSGKDFEEVLRMQQQLLKYQKMKASALTEFYIALAELNYITGK